MSVAPQPFLASLIACDRQIAWWLFASLACLYALSTGGHFYASDAWQKMLALDAMLTRGTVFFDLGWVPVPGGQHTSFYPLGGSLLMLPGYLVGKLLAPLAPMVPPDFVQRFCIVLQNAVFSAGLVALVFLYLRRLAYGVGAALFAALALALATTVWPYAKTCWSEPGVALLVFGAFYLLQVASSENFARWKPVWGAGLCLGLAIIIRLESALVCPGALAWLAYRHRADWQPLVRASAILAVPLCLAIAACLAYNHARFGNAWTFSNWQTVQNVIVMPAGGRPVWALQNLWHYTLNPNDGMLWFSPGIALGLLGWRVFQRHNPGPAALTLLAVVPLFVFFFAAWGLSDWAWGMRYGYGFLPFLLLPAAALWQLQPARQGLWLTIFTMGVLVQVLAVPLNFGYLYERERARFPGLSIQELMATPQHAPLLLALRDWGPTMVGGYHLLTQPGPGLTADVAEMRRRSQFVPDFWWLLMLLSKAPSWAIGSAFMALLVLLATSLFKLRQALKAAEVAASWYSNRR